MTLKQRRKQMGYTQKDLADILEMTEQSYSNKESARVVRVYKGKEYVSVFSASERDKLCKVLKLNKTERKELFGE